MRVLVTGSSGHLGQALVRTLRERGADVIGLDIRRSEWTNAVGSVADADLVREVMVGVDIVLHTATLHKPQVAFLPRQAFVDTNVRGTLVLLDAAADASVRAFVMSSSTTVFGDVLVPAPGEPEVWVDESVVPVPKNIYGVTKAAAEDPCQLAYRNQALPCVVLRVSRFFPEVDDTPDAHDGRADDNVKADEYASRRVALEDAVDAHLLAAERAPELGFGRYVISATTPFRPEDLPQLRTDASAVFHALRAGSRRGMGRTRLALPPPAGPRLRQCAGATGVGVAATIRPACHRADGRRRRHGPHADGATGGLKGILRQFLSARRIPPVSHAAS